MSKLSIVFFVLLTVALTSCLPTLTLTKVSNLRKGISPAEAITVSTIQPKNNFHFNHLEESTGNITVQVYILTSGTHKSDYFYMFVEDELFFWGYPHEFSRSSNSLINKVGKLTVTELEKN